MLSNACKRFALPLALAAGCAAQDASDVHLRPRTIPTQQPPAPGDAGLQTHGKPFVSNVDVVLVP